MSRPPCPQRGAVLPPDPKRGSSGARFLALAALVAAAACTDPVEPGRALSIGVIHADGRTYVAVPDSAVAGQPFTVHVLTFGIRGCIERSHTQVEYSAPRTAIVTPWNHNPAAGTNRVCPDVRYTREHVATLRFDHPGEVRVSIRGHVPGGLAIVHRYVQIR